MQIMQETARSRNCLPLLVAIGLCFSSGCALSELNPFDGAIIDRVEIAGPLHASQQPPASPPGRELDKMAMPPYIIEPPDVILIDAVNVIPLPPHRIKNFDVLQVNIDGTLFERPIEGEFVVEPDGTLNLGFEYGNVRVLGMTIDEAKAEIEKHLLKTLKNPIIRTVSLAFTAAAQQIAGPHLVRPDGTVDLGTYGQVFVAGLTIQDAKKKIEKHLSAELQDPEVLLDIQDYRSKVYYIVTKQPGVGVSVQALPLDGSETVLDAIRRVGGIGAETDPTAVYIARPRTDGGCPLIIPVDLKAIAILGDARTNYQLLPGDRLVLPPEDLAEFTAYVDAFTAPFERILGFVTFMQSTFQRLKHPGRNNNNNNF
jgi:polysaccharide export outer membrane protein